MKKQNILFLTLVLLFSTVAAVHAQSITPTASPTVAPTSTPTQQQSAIDKISQDLQARIASRVAQLNLVEKRGIIGTVTDISGTELTLSDIQNNIRFVDVNELTKFSSDASSSFGLSDISKGSVISVLGLYNKDSKHLSANFVDTMILPTIVHGSVSSIDPKNFNLTVETQNNKTIGISIETTTKIYSYVSTAGLTKIGFSKITGGEHTIIIGFPDKKDNNLIIPTRVLLFPDIAASSTPTPTATPTVSVKIKTTPAQ